MTWHLIWLWAAQTLVSGLAGVGLIGAVLAAFGRGWITHFFDRRIERVRAAQQQEIEQLKTKLGRLQDRGVRSNEREYDALITAWEKFVDAYIATTNCIMSFIQYPDLNLMQADEVDEYLKETELSERQQRQVMAEADKNKMYVKVLRHRGLAAAAGATSLVSIVAAKVCRSLR